MNFQITSAAYHGRSEMLKPTLLHRLRAIRVLFAESTERFGNLGVIRGRVCC